MGAADLGPDALQLLEYPRQRDPVRQRREARALNGGAVGHRIAEGHADLHHVADIGDGGEIVLKVAPRRKSGGQIIRPARGGP